MQSKSRRVALVTGASSGIGAAVARRLAESGYHVLVNYRNNDAGAQDVVNSCRAVGAESDSHAGDVSSDADCRAIVAAALSNWGRLDCVVNNAGTTRFADAGSLDGLDAADFARIFAVNVTGAYQVTRAAEAALRSAAGAVVNVSSHSGFSGIGSSMAYAASKGALNTLTLSLARSLAPEVTVNAVCPGFVDTDWMTPAMSARDLADFKRRVARTAPLERMVTADEVAESVCWFALGGRSITGQLLIIDGGTHLTVGSPL